MTKFLLERLGDNGEYVIEAAHIEFLGTAACFRRNVEEGKNPWALVLDIDKIVTISVLEDEEPPEELCPDCVMQEIDELREMVKSLEHKLEKAERRTRVTFQRLIDRGV